MPLRPVVNGAAFIGDGLPVFDMSLLDAGQPLLSNPALGQGVAAALGTSEAVLLSGHGFVMTGNTVYNAVRRAYYMRQNAISQLQALSLGGAVTYLNERRMPTEPQAVPAGLGLTAGRPPSCGAAAPL